MKEVSLTLKGNSKTKKSINLVTGELAWLSEVSFSGWVLFGLSLLLVPSIFKSLRINVAGLQMHLYLLPLIPLFLLIAVPRIGLFPKKILSALLVFLILFFLSVVLSEAQDTNAAFSEIFKIGASVITIVTCSLMIKNKFDFRIAVLGICIAAAIISLHNILTQGSSFGGSPLNESEVIANKNGFSMYVLPSVLLGGFWVIKHDTSKLLRLVLSIIVMIIVVAVFASGNRSGWFSVLFIGVLLLGRGRNVRSIILLCLIALGSYYGLTRFVGTETFEQRIEQSTQKPDSDETRVEIIPTAFEIALENPIFGISPQHVSYELGRKLPNDAVLMDNDLVLDPHNVVAFIMASSGFPCLLALIFLGWTTWQRPRHWKGVLSNFDEAKDSHLILRVMLLLWIIRGMFTREILYSPSFSIALGLSIGFCISQGLWIPKAINLYNLKLAIRKLSPAK